MRLDLNRQQFGVLGSYLGCLKFRGRGLPSYHMAVPAVECVPRFTICLAYLIKNGDTHTRSSCAAADDRYLGSGETWTGMSLTSEQAPETERVAVSLWIGNPFEEIY